MRGLSKELGNKDHTNITLPSVFSTSCFILIGFQLCLSVMPQIVLTCVPSCVNGPRLSLSAPGGLCESHFSDFSKSF